MAKTLQELLAEYQKNVAYTPLTQEQMQQQANNRYSGVYDQKKLSAQQSYQTNDQLLAQQLAGLQATYDKQREQSRQNYENAFRTADRQSVGRGMQRSSYNNATLANINMKSAKAQQEINDTQAAQEKNITDQRKLLSQQLSDTLAGYDAAKQGDIMAYIDELEAREYDRGVTAQGMAADQAQAAFNAQMQQEQMAYQRQQDALAQKNWQTSFDYQKLQNELESQRQKELFEYQKLQDTLTQQNWQTTFDYQKAQDALAQQNWLAEFDARYGGGDAGGGYSGGSPKPPAVDDDFNDALDEAGKVTTYPNQTDTRVLKSPSNKKVNPNRATVSVSKY